MRLARANACIEGSDMRSAWTRDLIPFRYKWIAKLFGVAASSFCMLICVYGLIGNRERGIANGFGDYALLTFFAMATIVAIVDLLVHLMHRHRLRVQHRLVFNKSCKAR